jgi:hypothetical protein
LQPWFNVFLFPDVDPHLQAICNHRLFDFFLTSLGSSSLSPPPFFFLPPLAQISRESTFKHIDRVMQAKCMQRRVTVKMVCGQKTHPDGDAEWLNDDIWIAVNGYLGDDAALALALCSAGGHGFDAKMKEKAETDVMHDVIVIDGGDGGEEYDGDGDGNGDGGGGGGAGGGCSDGGSCDGGDGGCGDDEDVNNDNNGGSGGSGGGGKKRKRQ